MNIKCIGLRQRRNRNIVDTHMVRTRSREPYNLCDIFRLQRIETFDGIAILASNLRDNVDDAFARRFESVIYFPMPRPEERLRLWRQGFSPLATLDRSVDLEALARDRVLSGGAIMNVILYASLQALKGGGRPISAEDLLTGISRELAKEGKTG